MTSHEQDNKVLTFSHSVTFLYLKSERDLYLSLCRIYMGNREEEEEE